MKSLSLLEVANILASKVDATSDPATRNIDELQVNAVSIDSRTMPEGALFFALKGENFDAHDFINAGKLEKASALVVEHKVESGLPQIIVNDTRIALGKLAKYCRQQFQGKVIAVTGSNGKTTVKEMCGSIMKEKGATLMTQGNLNNDIGLPLTLLNLENQDYAVVELGANHHGEISYLTNIALPDAAGITHAGNAHLEGFGSVEGVAKAKAEIFEGLSAQGVAVINIDDQYKQIWLDLTKERRVFTFALKGEADFTADWKISEQGSELKMKLRGESVSIILFVPGVHNVMNALISAALTYAIGFSVAEIKTGLEKMQAVKGRLQWNNGPGGMRVLDDTYNANPTSLSAGLAVLATVAGEHWLILGDMGELGPQSVEMHEEAGRLARRAGVTRLLTFGSSSRFASENFGEGGQHFSQQNELLETVEKEWLGEGAILIKGSRAMRMERFVEALVQQKSEP